MPLAARIVGGAAVVMAMGASGTIGAALGIERREHRPERGAEPAQHRLEHMVAPDEEMIGRDLGWRMTVADMPGKPGEPAGQGTDFDERLRLSFNANHLAGLRAESITMIERNRFREIYQKVGTRTCLEHPTAKETALVVESDGITRMGC